MEKLKKTFYLLRERKIYERLDVYPFVIIQSLLIIVYSNQSINSLVRGIIFGIVCLSQGLTFFCKFWSENLMAKICYLPVDTIEKATSVKVDITSEKFKMNNRTQICNIIRENSIIKTELEKIFYVYDEVKKEFYRPKLETLKKLKVGEFLSVQPISNDEVSKLKAKFGENKMRIPIPSFFSLYKEHIVAPFFVFQLFCILLWVFDDYGLHSLISLAMLCIFEVTVVGQRIFNLATLRNMRVPPHYIFVYRNKTWKKILSSDLLPGDIVSVISGDSVMTVKEEEDQDTKGNFILGILKKLKMYKKKGDERIQKMKKMKNKNEPIKKEKKEKEASPLTCDMLLLSGSIIVNESMLTGESVPQIKDSVTKLDYLRELPLDAKLKHKNSILFAGTKVVKSERNEEHEPLPKFVESPPPDRGAVCYVIKTGFGTSQGKLLRTVLYSGERNKGDDTIEAFVFIGVLLVIALIASYYVLKRGLEREGTLTYKLLLRCIIIITSVVPAELPIELSLTINNSLFFLQSKRIICIEPFRIPFAGKIDICCFDKTGTLTKDEFIMRGMVQTNSTKPLNAIDSNEEILSVLLGCNSLLNINGKPVGDPIEVAMFKEVKGKIDRNEMTCERKTRVVPIRKYQFESSLKRMTVLARVYSGVYQKKFYNRVLCKGAPETIKTLLKEVPENYDECYRKWAKEGYRILALAYVDNEAFDYNTKREDLEKDLIFCGFAIVETPLKASVSKYITELIKAKYGVCIITGDHLLTTSKVSKDLKLGPDKFGLLKIEDGKIKWHDLDNNFIKETKSVEEIVQLSKEYTLGLTGDEYKNIDTVVKSIPNIHEMTQYITLYCRVSPTQKDDIIKDLIKSGRNPSMCGDGSNDVGALKRAIIGVAVLNIEETETQKKEPFNFLSFDDESTIKNGDVTAAAPFTSKSGSIKCVKNIFIQGRCTLVTNFQMYKILALNCLMTAYSESVLALKGIKFSDYQATIMGFVVSIFFLMLSRAKPLNKVNSNKPPLTIFTLPAIISIIGQAVVDLGAMILILYLTEQIDPLSIGQEKSLDEKFTPTLINSIMFLFQLLNQTITFVVNYQGEPFMENLSTNGAMKKLLIGIAVFSCIFIFDLYPQLNENLELIPLPEDTIYRWSLICIILINFALCYLLEKWKSLFDLYEPYPKSKPKTKKN